MTIRNVLTTIALIVVYYSTYSALWWNGEFQHLIRIKRTTPEREGRYLREYCMQWLWPISCATSFYLLAFVDGVAMMNALECIVCVSLLGWLTKEIFPRFHGAS